MLQQGAAQPGLARSAHELNPLRRQFMGAGRGEAEQTFSVGGGRLPVALARLQPQGGEAAFEPCAQALVRPQHAARGQRVRSRQHDGVGQLVVVQDGLPAGGPADQVDAPLARQVGVHDRQRLAVAQAQGGGAPRVETQRGRRGAVADVFGHGLIGGEISRSAAGRRNQQPPGFHARQLIRMPVQFSPRSSVDRAPASGAGSARSNRAGGTGDAVRQCSRCSADAGRGIGEDTEALWGRSMRRIEEHFSQRFQVWRIELPREAVDNRQRGKIVEAGWTIWYQFGSDEDGEYLDYYSSHRMTNDSHVRIHEDGRVESLDSLWDGAPDIEGSRRERAAGKRVLGAQRAGGANPWRRRGSDSRATSMAPQSCAADSFNRENRTNASRRSPGATTTDVRLNDLVGR